MLWEAIGIAFVGTLAVAALRQVKPELAVFAGLVTGVVIILLVTDALGGIIEAVGGAAGGTESGGSIFKSIIKIIGIGYITEYSASVCEDYGSQSIAKKVQLAGKVSIFVLAVPIITGIIEAIGALVK